MGSKNEHIHNKIYVMSINVYIYIYIHRYAYQFVCMHMGRMYHVNANKSSGVEAHWFPNILKKKEKLREHPGCWYLVPPLACNEHKLTLIFHKQGFQLPALLRCWEIMENINILYFFKTIQPIQQLNCELIVMLHTASWKISTGNGLLPVRYQAIICANTDYCDLDPQELI